MKTINNAIVTAFALLSLASAVLATGQVGERIRYGGEDLELLTLPLRQYPGESDVEIGFYRTGNWRGYVGHWKIRSNNKLYLSKVLLEGTYEDYERGADIIDEYFPERPRRLVEATWFTGDLRIIPGGSEIVRYQHMDFARLYEREILVGIVDGEVVSVRELEVTERERNSENKTPMELIDRRVKKGITDVDASGVVVKK